MKKRTQIAVAGAAAIVAAGFATGAVATSADDDATEQPITGAALDRAERAALAEVGAGTVTGTEVGDEESLYEVEVTRDDGTEVDVQLDADFAVVGQEADDSAEDGDSD